MSRQHYRRFVHADADFYAWFQAVTPIDVITRMQIGSRPAVRPGKEGFEALRAVPWVFAWTQSRHMLPAWYGAGLGLKTAIDELGTGDGAFRLRANGRFSRTLIDDLEASLARADLEIAAAYESLAEPRLQALRGASARGIRAGARAGAGNQADHGACWIATRPCSAPSSCAIPTSIRSTCCRSIY